MRRWFLPETPDVLGMLRRQMEVTVEGIDALAAWGRGDAAQADAIRALEHRADEHKRELQQALVAAFTTPLEPEDIFALSRGLDWILNHAKDAVRESEVMGLPPDEAIAEMSALLAAAVRSLAEAVEALGDLVVDVAERVWYALVKEA